MASLTSFSVSTRSRMNAGPVSSSMAVSSRLPMTMAPLIAKMTHVDQHHDEKEEHHDAAGIDQDLHRSDELGRLHHEQNRDAEKRQQQEKRGMHRVSHPDHEDRRRHCDRTDDEEDDEC